MPIDKLDKRLDAGTFMKRNASAGRYRPIHTLFGAIKTDGSNLKIQQTSNRDMHFGPAVTCRLVIKLDMMELYINDYLMNLKRVKCKGQIGFMGSDNEGTFKNIKVWQSN